VEKVNIGIGELHVATEPTVISTILGSCVSVCLFDPVRKVGGMNHMLLPGSPDMKEFNESARYGINAMELLINGLLKIGASRSNLRAKVFGGGHIFNVAGVTEIFTPGKDNTTFAFSFLEDEDLPVESYNVGGSFGRKIYFESDTGEVLMKRIKALSTSTVREREQRFRRTLQEKGGKEGTVSLFTNPMNRKPG
jgi:chemotaxis protein CheD